MATPTDTPDFNAQIADQQAQQAAEQTRLQTERDAAIKPVEAERHALSDDIQAGLKKGPEQVQMPTNPAQHVDSKTLNDTASMMMTWAGLAGLLTRRPMTAALNNMTAAMQGLQAGDEEQYNRSYKEFQDNYKKAADLSKEKLTEYDRVMKSKEMSLAEKDRELTAIAKRYGDQIAVSSKSFSERIKHIESERTAGQKSQELAEKIRESDRTFRQRERFHADSQGGGATDQEDLIEGIASGRINPNVVSTRGNQRAKIMEEVAKRYPDYDSNTFTSRTAAQKAFSTGKQGDMVRSFGVVDSHLKTLEELGDALHNGDAKAINRVANAVAEQTGSAAPTSFEAAKRIVGDEIVKAVTGAAGALGDREEAANTINRANSPEQLKGVIQTYRKLINGQVSGLRKQYETSTGKHDFNDRFKTSGESGERTVKRTGTHNGKKVVEYSDGTIEYAD